MRKLLTWVSQSQVRPSQSISDSHSTQCLILALSKAPWFFLVIAEHNFFNVYVLFKIIIKWKLVTKKNDMTHNCLFFLCCVNLLLPVFDSLLVFGALKKLKFHIKTHLIVFGSILTNRGTFIQGYLIIRLLMRNLTLKTYPW